MCFKYMKMYVYMCVCIFVCIYPHIWGFPGGSVVKNPPANVGDTGLIPGSGDPTEKEMAIHSSILAWETLWTEELGGLQSLGSQKSWTQLSD